MTTSAPLLARLRALFALAGCRRVGARVVVYGRVSVRGRARISIGDDVVIDGRRAPVELNAGPGGEIDVGPESALMSGASLESATSVTVGARVVVQAFAKLLDSPFHATSGDRHARQRATPVVVEDDAVIGHRAILLPGAHVGAGAIVRPATVVSHAVKPGHTALGVPTRVAPPGRA